jgi:hypothetical protein
MDNDIWKAQQAGRSECADHNSAGRNREGHVRPKPRRRTVRVPRQKRRAGGDRQWIFDESRKDGRRDQAAHGAADHAPDGNPEIEGRQMLHRRAVTRDLAVTGERTHEERHNVQRADEPQRSTGVEFERSDRGDDQKRQDEGAAPPCQDGAPAEREVQRYQIQAQRDNPQDGTGRELRGQIERQAEHPRRRNCSKHDPSHAPAPGQLGIVIRGDRRQDVATCPPA